MRMRREREKKKLQRKELGTIKCLAAGTPGLCWRELLCDSRFCGLLSDSFAPATTATYLSFLLAGIKWATLRRRDGPALGNFKE